MILALEQQPMPTRLRPRLRLVPVQTELAPVSDPVFETLQPVELWRLVRDFFSGLLAKHDFSLGLSRTRSSGHGSALTRVVESRQVEDVLQSMGKMSQTPEGAAESVMGWPALCLEFAGRDRLSAEDLQRFSAWPVPTASEIATAFAIFARLLYRKLFIPGAV